VSAEARINSIIWESTKGTLADFSDLYEEYNPMVRATIFKLCGFSELDDLVQDAFVRIWNGLQSFRQGSKLKTWIYRIAYNVALDGLRRKKPVTAELMLVHGKLASGEKDIINRDLVLKGLQELTFEHRAVIVLHLMEGLSIAEVGEVLEIPEGTVKSRLHHAKERMAGILKSKGVNLS